LKRKGLESVSTSKEVKESLKEGWKETVKNAIYILTGSLTGGVLANLIVGRIHLKEALMGYAIILSGFLLGTSLIEDLMKPKEHIYHLLKILLVAALILSLVVVFRHVPTIPLLIMITSIIIYIMKTR